jgi:hypothetical protein
MAALKKGEVDLGTSMYISSYQFLLLTTLVWPSDLKAVSFLEPIVEPQQVPSFSKSKLILFRVLDCKQSHRQTDPSL